MVNVLLITFTVIGFVVGYYLRPLVLTDAENETKFSLKSIFKFKFKKDLLAYNFLYGIISAILSFILASKILFENTEFSLPIKILAIIIILAIGYGLLYLSAFDFEYFEIPDIFSLILCIVIFLLNICLYFVSDTISLWSNNTFNPLSNIFAGLLAGGFIFVIVFLTKGKGMGSGDIRIAAILGLVLGMDKLLAGFYVTILSASVVGIIYSIRLKKFHGVQIPFVPFIVLGTIIAFLYSHELMTWFLSFYEI